MAVKPITAKQIATAPVERILCFDLESRPSAYWYDGNTTAEITAFGWKWQGSDVETLLLKANGRFVNQHGRTFSAEQAYRKFRSVLLEADLVFGHNIRGFDLPLFQAGLWRLQLPLLPKIGRTSDTLKDIPRRKDMSASLENLAELYQLDDDGKLHMSIMAWEKANRLLPAGVEKACRRVASDVLLQERLRLKLLEIGLLRKPKAWKP